MADASFIWLCGMKNWPGCEPPHQMNLLAWIKASQLGLWGIEWPLLCSFCHYLILQPHTNPVIAVVKHNVLYLTAMLYLTVPSAWRNSPCNPPFLFSFSFFLPSYHDTVQRSLPNHSLWPPALGWGSKFTCGHHSHNSAAIL